MCLLYCFVMLPEVSSQYKLIGTWRMIWFLALTLQGLGRAIGPTLPPSNSCSKEPCYKYALEHTNYIRVNENTTVFLPSMRLSHTSSNLVPSSKVISENVESKSSTGNESNCLLRKLMLDGILI
jgi:hypothetical protein